MLCLISEGLQMILRTTGQPGNLKDLFCWRASNVGGHKRWVWGFSDSTSTWIKAKQWKSEHSSGISLRECNSRKYYTRGDFRCATVLQTKDFTSFSYSWRTSILTMKQTTCFSLLRKPLPLEWGLPKQDDNSIYRRNCSINKAFIKVVHFCIIICWPLYPKVSSIFPSWWNIARPVSSTSGRLKCSKPSSFWEPLLWTGFASWRVTTYKVCIAQCQNKKYNQNKLFKM